MIHKFYDYIRESANSNLDFLEDKMITNPDNGLIYVGYWKNEDGNWYGMPEANWVGWDDEKLYYKFLNNLKKKMENSRKRYYKGYSGCRICDLRRNGTSEHIIDNKFIMPSGYIHYIEEHKIKPHRWFLDYIISQKNI